MTRCVTEHHSDHIHLLFNNAGTAGGGAFVNGNRADWERTFNIDWFGVYFNGACLHAHAGGQPGGLHRQRQQRQRLLGQPRAGCAPHTAYSAAKFAVKGFTEALITDLRTNAPHVSCALVMPGHIGTSIALNTYDARKMPAALVAVMRARMLKAGAPVADASDDAIRALMHQRAVDFRDKAPTSADQAATTILDGVRAGRWRILVGDDAERLDVMVRNAPEEAYEAAFAAAWREGKPGLGQ